MKMLFRATLLVMMLPLAAAAALPVAVPSVPAPSIEGRIVEIRGYIMHGLTVRAINESTRREFHAITDEQGRFALAYLEPGRYVLTADCVGSQQILGTVQVRARATESVQLLAEPIRQTGNIAIDKHIGSTIAQGGSYPAGNISYLNINDGLDLYFMWVYFGILGLLSVYGIYRYRLVYLFLRYKNHPPKPKSHFDRDRLPRVTVQLPLFNEMYVAERLIDSVVKLDYPRELLEIQVLDDSTDDTREIARQAVKRHFDAGHDIVYHHRTNREGFKAGALEAGLKKSSGELVLIFDADFLPRPDTILKMVDYFTDERVGMVQMRWSHINPDYSLLTRVQAIMLDAHFVIEQTSRNRAGGFFNFNGTAGMWRREAIEWSGGWQHDTLAEDTDLSYRAQLMGWHFVYLMDEDVPAELPVEMNAFKSQQRRWAKGVVQVGVKLMKRIWRDPRLSLRIKLEQFFRLTANLAAPLVIVLALINLPILIVRYNQGLFHLFVLDVPILTFSTLSVIVFYVVTLRHLHPETWKSQLKYIPLVMSMGIALTFNNARAVLEALIGVKSAFVRTPKYRIEKTGDAWARKSYVKRGLSFPFLELLFAIYFAFTIWYAIDSGIVGTLPFLLIYFCGYAYAVVLAIAQSRLSTRRK